MHILQAISSNCEVLYWSVKPSITLVGKLLLYIIGLNQIKINLQICKEFPFVATFLLIMIEAIVK